MTAAEPLRPAQSHHYQLCVLAMIAFGLILIIVLIICGLFGWFESKVTAPLPNWAENVLVSIASVAGLKLGDTLNALVQLALGRQLANSQPLDAVEPKQPTPKSAQEGAERVADAAEQEKDAILATPPDEPPEGGGNG